MTRRFPAIKNATVILRCFIMGGVDMKHFGSLPFYEEMTLEDEEPKTYRSFAARASSDGG